MAYNRKPEKPESFHRDTRIPQHNQGTNPCSVTQGSKHSGFLYTIFSIEIPVIPILLRQKQLLETLMEMNIPQFYGTEHRINRYVNDSSNMIGTDTVEEMKIYIENYINVLEKFYSHNGLNINSRKTKIMITKQSRNYQNKAITTFKTSSGEKIKVCNSMKILGL